jgi:hypothetical protein
MADNITLPGIGIPVATDDVGGIHWQFMKLAYGPDGAATAVDSNAPLPVSIGGAVASAVMTAVAASVTSVQLLAARAARKGAVITNDGAATLYIGYGATTSMTAYTYKMPPNAVFEMPLPIWTGAISAIWNGALGSAVITELY